MKAIREEAAQRVKGPGRVREYGQAARCPAERKSPGTTAVQDSFRDMLIWIGHREFATEGAQ